MATPIVELEGTWEEISEHAAEFAGRRLRVVVLPDPELRSVAAPDRPASLSPRELMRLPPAERSRILAEQAAVAEPLYREPAELTDFEAFGEDDLHVDTP